MKNITFLLLACGMFASAFAQPEVPKKNTESSDKWVITPVSTMKGVLGRLDVNFPPDVYWGIQIYKQADNKYEWFTSVFSSKSKSYSLAPGVYLFDLMGVPVENVPIQKGHETRLKAGFLSVVSEGTWHLYNEAKEKIITSGHKPNKIALPVGSYQISLGGQFYPVTIKDGETVEDYSPVGIKDQNAEESKTLTDHTTDTKLNPEALVDDQYQYIMFPVADVSDTALATKGRLNFGLTTYDFWSPGEGYRFKPRIYNEAGAEIIHTCPGEYGLCTHNIYLAEGKYSFTATWTANNGSINVKSPIRILNVPVKKGFETRIKVGFLRNLTSGDFELLDEKKEIIHWQYANRGTSKRPIPVGKYFVRQPGIGIFSIEIGDRKEVSLNTIQTSKNESPSFRISPNTLKSIKKGMGRLNCDFPHADTSYRLKMPNTNSSLTNILLDTLKFIDLLPGKYELWLDGLTLPFQIENQKETNMIYGYIKTNGMGFHDPVRGVSFGNMFQENITVPVPLGYYYIKRTGSPEVRNFLIKVSEGEIVDYELIDLF